MKKILSGIVLFCFGTQFVLANSQRTFRPLRLATTTSTENSGLLQKLLPHFEKQSGYKVYVLSVGSGHALRMGQDGNVDVVLIHAPQAETRFVEAGFGVNRRNVMFNDFVIVGPPHDPAGVRGERDAVRALQKIARGKHLFLSRGDDSGTHKKELLLWEKAQRNTGKIWYREAGQGMGRVLQMAGELGAYTISDRATWLVLRQKLQPKTGLKLLVEGDPRLHNPYSVIAVNPSRYPEINYLGAMSLIAWLTSVEGQKHIREFRLEGQSLFTPTAITN